MFRFDKEKLEQQIAKIQGIKKLKLNINNSNSRKQNNSIACITDMLFRLKQEIAVIHELEKKINS